MDGFSRLSTGMRHGVDKTASLILLLPESHFPVTLLRESGIPDSGMTRKLYPVFSSTHFYVLLH